MSDAPKVLALYLPQFHPTPHNDEWWGKGFTEWTNVGRAKKLYRGHPQPRIPGELGYYDLRLSEVREAQADLARAHGVSAFCYYHYWFGDGRQELERPFQEVVAAGKPDFPFCLCWANETWYTKMWDVHGCVGKKPLVAQEYGNAAEITKHFNHLLPAFRDPRYLRIAGKLIFMIYRPLEIPNVDEFMRIWRDLATANGLDGIYFIAHCTNLKRESEALTQLGFDGIHALRMNAAIRSASRGSLFQAKLIRKALRRPRVIDYGRIYRDFIGDEEKSEGVFPSLIPNWDHTPRSGMGGTVLHGTCPRLFQEHVEHVVRAVAHKTPEENLIFLKSWNEWGEGNYMEPDLEHGRGFLEALAAGIERGMQG